MATVMTHAPLFRAPCHDPKSDELLSRSPPSLRAFVALSRPKVSAPAKWQCTGEPVEGSVAPEPDTGGGATGHHRCGAPPSFGNVSELKLEGEGSW